jgi:hypothetical protein
MHVQQTLGTRPLVQIVYILRTKEEPVSQAPLDLCESNVRRVGFGQRSLRAPR